MRVLDRALSSWKGISDVGVFAALVVSAVMAKSATFVVTNAASSGTGSIRDAITQANSNPGPDVISFNLPGAAQIHLTSPLPAITEPVRIDGTTQPGYAGSPLLQIDGSLVSNSAGLSIQTSNCVVVGLAITRFSGGSGAALLISGSSATGNWIYGNYVGVDVGTNLAPNYHGVVFDNGAHDNLLGPDASGTNNVTRRNWITGNLGDGVVVRGAATRRIQIVGNSISGNGGIGIDLGEDGPTLDDASDADAGPNDLQNFPVLTSAESGMFTMVM